MNSLEGYFLGMFTVIFVIITFWLFATINNGIGDLYRNTLGYQICSTS